MAVQVLGKLKGTVTVPWTASRRPSSTPPSGREGRQGTEGMQIVKVILVKNKLINLIVKPKA